MKNITFFIAALFISFLFVQCRQSPAKQADIKAFVGKYEANGMVVQVAMVKEKLTLVVPGAPLQLLIAAGINKYKSSTLGEEVFEFVEKDGKIAEMVSNRGGQAFSLKKIGDIVDDFNKNDSLLTLKRSTDHFSFLYSNTDSVNINRIAEILERDHKKIPGDFKVSSLPVVTVRVFPDLNSFHQSINFPGAPKEVMATAFGKDDFRMVSPTAPDVDSAVLMKGVTHEFTHVVHLNVDYSPNNPRWLWEGVAMYEANWFFDPAQIPGIKEKQFPPLSALGGGVEYVLGYVIIEAIVDTWGFDTVLDLVKKQGDVKAVLNIDPKKFEEMVWEKIYNKYILKK
jgi:hypothetical protein